VGGHWGRSEGGPGTESNSNHDSFAEPDTGKNTGSKQSEKGKRGPASTPQKMKIGMRRKPGKKTLIGRRPG